LGILLGRHFVHFAGHLTQTHILRPSHQGIFGHLVCVAPGHFSGHLVCRAGHLVCVAPRAFDAQGIFAGHLVCVAPGHFSGHLAFGVRRTRAFFWAFGVPRWAFGVRRTKGILLGIWCDARVARASHKGILGNLVRRRLFGHIWAFCICVFF
jgi:hypothetical protein